MNFAVIDLGSNTIRLSVYRYEDEKLVTAIRQKEVAGLAGYVKDGALGQDGIDKACDILKDFKEIAVRFVEETDIRVFATASLRGIANQSDSVQAIQQSTGLLPEVLTGEEEARLDFIGAAHYTECRDGLLIDIGGASTELVRFENGEPVRLASMPVGCLSLYTGFVGKVIPDEKERKRIKKEIRAQLDALSLNAVESIPLMLGVGGTVRAALKLSRELFDLPKEQRDIKAGYIGKILSELKNNENAIYRTVYKLIPERTLTIYPGLMILSEAIKRFGSESIFVSDYGVREGYLFDRILKEGGPVRADGACENGGLYAEPGAVVAEIQ